MIETILKSYTPKGTDLDLISLKAVKKLECLDDKIFIELEFGFPIDDISDQIRQELSGLIQAKVSQKPLDIQLSIGWKVQSHKTQTGLSSLPQVKNIIAIASGKGGVGKSTVCANLALALSAQGAKVGVLDADIYGPSQPHLLGSNETPTHENKKLHPVICYGLQTMSIGYLVDRDNAMIWRGPMVSSALQQLLNDTLWENLDYLFIDLPPGTGDIQLTLSQKIPVSAAVVITTPQDLSLIDVTRALNMFAKVKVPVLGIIENMSTHICSQCGHLEAIFGEGGGKKISGQYETALLGQLPLDIQIREDADQGKPTVIAKPDSEITNTYKAIARRLAARLSLQAKNYAKHFSNIVIEPKQD